MAKAAAEPSKPLLYSLIFFVLLTLGLGYLVYATNESKTAAVDEAKKAKADSETAQKTAAMERDEKLIYKSAMGLANDKDMADLGGSRYVSDAKRVHGDMVKAIEARTAKAIEGKAGEFVGKPPLALRAAELYAWPWPDTATAPPAPPARGLIDVAVANFSQRQLADARYNDELRSMQEMTKKMQELSVTLDQAKKTLDARTNQIPAEVGAEIAKVADAFEKYKKGFQDQQRTSRDDLTKKDEELQAKNIDVKRANERVERVTAANADMQSRLDSKLDPFQFDQPQGKVLRRNGNTVEIDLGSASNLRVGLTFSVMPADTPQRGMESRMRRFMDRGVPITRIVPKGSIEVVEILGPNLSSARITFEESEVRDRVLTGDLLYNAVWRKGQSEHIALYGIFDIDGDGRDDVNAVVAELRKMGVSVDAVFDLGENKWKGEITSQTTLAVEGYSPSVTVADGNREGKTRIISAISDARKFVTDKGIRVLRPRDFFPRVGYRVKLDLSEDTINQAATYYIRSQGAEGTDSQPKN